MKTKRFVLLALVTALAVVLTLNTVYAQDATATPVPDAEQTDEPMDTSMEGGMVTCDADLILSLYIAEHYFGFSNFANQMPSDTMINIDDFDKGQYASLFDSMSGMNNATRMSSETNTAMMDMMAMNNADYDAQMNESMMSGDTDSMNLTVHNVTDEPQECEALRHGLRRFFTALAMNDVQMSGVGTGMDTGSTDTQVAEGAITVNLSGAVEVPAMGDEDGSGAATVYLRTDTNEVCVDIALQNVTLPTTAAHIHQAPTGQAGAPVVTLNAPDQSGVSSTCVVVDDTLMQDLLNNPANYYVNVHNDEFPDGAVRGQLN